jgi:hypothetical protein
MRNIGKTFSGILIGALIVGGIGLLWLSNKTTVSSVQAAQFNAYNTTE